MPVVLYLVLLNVKTKSAVNTRWIEYLMDWLTTTSLILLSYSTPVRMGSEVYWDNPRNFWYERRIAVNRPGQVRSDEVRWGRRFAALLNSIWGFLTQHINSIFLFRARPTPAWVKCAPLRLSESFGDIYFVINKIIFILWNTTAFRTLLYCASKVWANVPFPKAE